MNFEVKLFAAAKEIAGKDLVVVDLEAGATVADLRTALVQSLPALQETIEHVKFAVNHDYADDDTRLSPDSEIACIPPVSGG